MRKTRTPKDSVAGHPSTTLLSMITHSQGVRGTNLPASMLRHRLTGFCQRLWEHLLALWVALATLRQ